MRNFEKIQSMSLEELAEAIQCPNDFLDAKIRCNKFEMYALPQTCTQCKMAWLQEGDEEDEPKEEPVEMTQVIEPEHDFWDGVRHELWGMKDSEIDKLHEDFEKILGRWIGGDHSEETTAAVMFYGEKVLNV